MSLCAQGVVSRQSLQMRDIERNNRADDLLGYRPRGRILKKECAWLEAALTCASLRSLMGIPIVLVNLPILKTTMRQAQ
ncbi:hypothetical protein GX48_00859 [Paracoccidioides brasiliensis]|nr:hypothetical protein GX48_00859 [Paracoccidioides brasiliensis]